MFYILPESRDTLGYTSLMKCKMKYTFYIVSRISVHVSNQILYSGIFHLCIRLRAFQHISTHLITPQ